MDDFYDKPNEAVPLLQPRVDKDGDHVDHLEVELIQEPSPNDICLGKGCNGKLPYIQMSCPIQGLMAPGQVDPHQTLRLVKRCP